MANKRYVPKTIDINRKNVSVSKNISIAKVPNQQPSNSQQYGTKANEAIHYNYYNIAKPSKNSKIIIILLIAILAVGIGIGSIFLYQNLTKDKTTTVQKSLQITNLRIEKVGEYNEYAKSILKWDEVSGAKTYVVTIGNRTFNTTYTEYDVTDLDIGEYNISVASYDGKEMGENSTVSHQSFGGVVTSPKRDEGAFGAFDDLSKQESFLGYGFNVIASNEFSANAIKIQNPILDKSKMSDMRLIKYKDNLTDTSFIEENSVEKFAQSWNASLKVDAKWLGGSVDIGASAGGSSNQELSQYFMAFDSITQNYYLALHGTARDWRERLSESFVADIQDSRISPQQLFSIYGTHYVTSAVMGGRLSSIYYMRTQTESNMLTIASDIKTNIQTLFATVGVEGSMDYLQEAAKQQVYINSKIRTQGGDNFGIMSDQDIKANFAAWQQSLEASPSLIGIRDNDSLLPIWDLVGEWDTQNQFTDINGVETTRRAQLQTYFEKYGLESWNKMRENYGLEPITPPTEIKDITINGNGVSEDGYYTVEIGTINPINQRVLPDQSLEYALSYIIDPNSDGYDYAKIVDGQLDIQDDPLAIGKTLRLTITAGSVYKKVDILITEFFKVIFDSNGGLFDISGANPEKIEVDKIRSGSFVSIPKLPNPTASMAQQDLLFIGWGLDKNTEDIYDIANTTINRESVEYPAKTITVFAIWSKQKVITVSFISNGGLFDMGNGSTSSTYGPVKVLDGQKANEPTIARKDHSFEGWYRDANFTTLFDFEQALHYDKQTISNNSITLFAKWTEVYKTMARIPLDNEWATFMILDLTGGASGTIIIPKTTQKIEIKGLSGRVQELAIVVSSRDTTILELTLNNLSIKPTETTQYSPLHAYASIVVNIIGAVQIQSHKETYSAMNLSGGTIQGQGALTVNGANGITNGKGISGSVGIYSSGNLSILMDSGNFKATGGNGSNGLSFAGNTWNNRSGGDGANGIHIKGTLILQGTLSSFGGNGGNGQSAGNNMNTHTDFRKGGNGGNGGAGIKATTLVVNSGKITAKGGSGGNGGRGGDSTGGDGMQGSGGDGGNSGNGGNGIEVMGHSSSGTIDASGGNAGTRGVGGWPNTGIWGNWKGDEGKNGSNGSNGQSIATDIPAK